MSTSTTIMSSFQLKPPLFSQKLQRSRGLRSPAKKPSSSFLRSTPSCVPGRVVVKSAQSTAGLNLANGLEVSTSRKTKGKVIHQTIDDYSADIGGQSPMYATEKRTHSHDHAGGTTGLLVWAASVGSVLLVGALIILISGVCYTAAPDYTLPPLL